MSAVYRAAQATDAAAAKTNLVYFNPNDAAALEKAPGKTVAPKKNYVEIKNYVFTFAYVSLPVIAVKSTSLKLALEPTF